MSVLLDALKKAAEEKKNAEKQESAAVTSDGLTLNDFDDNRNEEVILEDDNDLVRDVQNELPIFNLKIEPDERETIDPLDVSLSEDKKVNNDVKLEIQEETNALRIDDTPSESTLQQDFDLTSLIDSLDIDENHQPDSNLSLVSIQDLHKTKSDLKLETKLDDNLNANLHDDTETVSEKNVKQPSDNHNSWDIDNLPSYSEYDENAFEKDKKSQQVNPVLLNTGSTAVESQSKYVTSSRIMVSLLVLLLFIGIGFYGMLYYQEQNEYLENSMRKYSLSKMNLSPKEETISPIASKESFEDVSALNVVSEKVIKLGNTIKDSVNSNIIEPLSINQGDIHPGMETLKVTDLNESPKDLDKPKIPVELKTYETAKVSATRIDNSKQTGIDKNNINSSSNNSDRKNELINNKIVLTGSVRSELGKAYTAYEKGEFIKAEVLFKEVLAKDSKNINALLGMGGVSVAKNEYRIATTYYQRVLNIQPNNLYAFESIANLSGQLELNDSWQSELNDMLNKYPESAVLQYAKGNIAAQNNDWLSAQKHYFEAYVLDSSNPDYMMNLAVSFDHLGKYSLAADYYTKALAYASSANVSFDKKQVKSRLISIRQFIEKGQ